MSKRLRYVSSQSVFTVVLSPWLYDLFSNANSQTYGSGPQLMATQRPSCTPRGLGDWVGAPFAPMGTLKSRGKPEDTAPLARVGRHVEFGTGEILQPPPGVPAKHPPRCCRDCDVTGKRGREHEHAPILVLPALQQL